MKIESFVLIRQGVEHPAEPAPLSAGVVDDDDDERFQRQPLVKSAPLKIMKNNVLISIEVSSLLAQNVMYN